MASEPVTGPQSPTDPAKRPGYQPSPGRKLFMMGLCIVALIFIWAYYFFSAR